VACGAAKIDETNVGVGSIALRTIRATRQRMSASPRKRALADFGVTSAQLKRRKLRSDITQA
jgi:hypothetical protein